MPALVRESEQKTIPASTATATQYVMACSTHPSSLNHTKDKLRRKALIGTRWNADQRLPGGQPGSSRRFVRLALLGQPGLVQVVVIKLKIDPFAVQALFKASAQFRQARAVGG